MPVNNKEENMEFEKVNNNNDGGRIYNVFIDIVEKCGIGYKQLSTDSILKKALHIEDENSMELIKKKYSLLNIITNTISYYESIEGNQKTKIRTLQEAMKLIIETNNFPVDISDFRGRCRSLLVQLEFVAESMENLCGEKIVEVEELKCLEAQIETLISDIKKSTINSDLKKILLQKLFDIRNYFEQYDLNGMKGIQEVINSTVGTLAMNQTQIKTDDEKKTVFKMFELIDKINKVFEFTTNVFILGSSAVPFVQNLIS